MSVSDGFGHGCGCVFGVIFAFILIVVGLATCSAMIGGG